MVIKGLTLLAKFKSKKNSVFLASTGAEKVVLKIFAPEYRWRARNEFYWLRLAYERGIPVPEIIDMRDHIIIQRYIPGENLIDLFNSQPHERFALALADWYAGLHRAFRDGAQTLLKGDGILKNFIWHDGLWGVDFEEAQPGDPVEDIGAICNSILNTEPMFTRDKFELCQILIDRYENKGPFKIKSRIDESIAGALAATARWRPAQREILLHMAAQIRRNGLKNLL